MNFINNSNILIYHDKLLEYGGAEVVLETFVEKMKPAIIYTTCISNRPFWENLYQTKIVSPSIFRFIKTQTMYRLFYPLICLLSPFFKPCNLAKSDIFVYSSTAAKFLSTSGAKSAFLYSNFPAKPFIRFNDYFANTTKLALLMPFVGITFFFWKKVELRALKKFSRIAVISKAARAAYQNLYGISALPEIKIIHCPVKNSVFNFAKKEFLKVDDFFSCAIVSRLYPEKNIEPLISFLAANKHIKLTVIGDGPLLEYFSSKYGADVIFTGFIDDLEKYSLIAESDFLLQPTIQEWSLATIESNILGTPVIGAHSDAMIEINQSVSGDDSIPNMTYKEFSDIPLLVLCAKERRAALERILHEYKNNFSIDSFISNINFKSILVNS
jgi:glycosyltransferase involved in cell wall biosynthesis